MIGLFNETVVNLLLGIGGILVLATIVAVLLGLRNRGHDSAHSESQSAHRCLVDHGDRAGGHVVDRETAVIVLFLGALLPGVA